jgi:signal transduction histidine kinase
VSFRTKIFLSITVTVLIAVWAVALTVSSMITQSFERRDAQRTAALVSQFQREFNRRGAEIARRTEAIANSDAVARVEANLAGGSPDMAQYVDLAQSLAQEQSLDFLNVVSPDGAIISSAEWPARFGYKEAWLLQPIDWNSQRAFLRREELAAGPALGLIAVRAVKAGTGSLYLAGGQRLDQEFVDSLGPTEGVNVQIYNSFDSQLKAETSGTGPAAGLVAEIRRDPRELSRTLPSTTYTGVPLRGRENELLAVLVIENSRAELLAAKAYLQTSALAVGAAGVLLGLVLSFWTASRMAKPLRELASSVREVADGKWGTRITARSSDEIGQLARDFNHMTEQLIEQRDRMIQAERVAAWRELARRLAHELKNPLFPLQITIENLQRARQASPEQFEEVFRESTSTLLAELDNLKTIIGRFSDFAKMPAPHPESVDVNELAREVLKLFDAQIRTPGRPPVTSRLDLAENLPAITVDPEMLRRALRNLILNALDAMPSGGSLVLRTERQDGKIALEVSDTGEGLTTEECERLFTPYYTTKRHGTGLGLAIVQSVVSDHKGTITVQSEPGKGTTFRIELKA